MSAQDEQIVLVQKQNGVVPEELNSLLAAFVSSLQQLLGLRESPARLGCESDHQQQKTEEAFAIRKLPTHVM
jgi:hypothetical protein